jgi:hypothetical protein
MSLNDFRMKRWEVLVSGHGAVTFDATTRGKAQAKACRAYQAAYDQTTFGDLLKMSTVRRLNDLPEHWGEPITVSGKPAFFVGYAGGNSLRFVWPNEDQILTSHLLDTTVPWTEKTDASISE